MGDDFVLGVSCEADLVANRVDSNLIYILGVKSRELSRSYIVFVEEGVCIKRCLNGIIIEEFDLVGTTLGIRFFRDHVLKEPFLNERFVSQGVGLVDKGVFKERELSRRARVHQSHRDVHKIGVEPRGARDSEDIFTWWVVLDICGFESVGPILWNEFTFRGAINNVTEVESGSRNHRTTVV